MPPELMGYEGRAVVVDPDVFAVGDVWELLTRDMQGKAIMCRRRAAPSGRRQQGHQRHAARLREAHALALEADFDELFTFKRDYMDWINLSYEDPDDDRR